MNDTLEIHQISGKRLFETVRMEQEAVTVADNRKFDLSKMASKVRNFTVHFFEDLHSKESQK